MKICSHAIKMEQINAILFFLSAYRVISFWGFCNAAVTAGQLSNFYKGDRRK